MRRRIKRLLNVPKCTTNLYCTCLSIPQNYTNADAVQICSKFSIYTIEYNLEIYTSGEVEYSHLYIVWMKIILSKFIKCQQICWFLDNILLQQKLSQKSFFITLLESSYLSLFYIFIFELDNITGVYIYIYAKWPLGKK